ncbi:MAG: ABC transporter permease [Opitutaceae bacterium]|nr:ABC transporter permease [Opitutaceae bacterium]
MNATPSALLLTALRHASLVLFVTIIAVFGALAPKFLTADNAINVLIQSTPTGIVAVGMTFVLLTAGVDLSVGAIMFLSAAIAGKMLAAGQPLPLALGAMLATGLGFGAINAFFITRLRIAPFIVTLALLFVGRGLALTITQTRAMNLPDRFLQLGSARVAGVPLPLVVLGAVLLVAHVVLMRTPFGRQIYALGNHPANARKAGIRTQRILATVYLISGLCAALGGILSLAQLGAVSPKFGEAYEFKAIAAAVLGGTSLFGGRGAVFPGTLLGAVLIQSIESGLVILNADPYLYPVITAAVIFLAVLTDSTRHTLLARLNRRRIRQELPT